jgi:hypothetical protein
MGKSTIERLTTECQQQRKRVLMADKRRMDLPTREHELAYERALGRLEGMEWTLSVVIEAAQTELI